ncbi:ABC transporter substrate-binding protein [Shewanella mangrovi]|uniref:ABC transporter substrate-binding protein n=1 Tax=Shewanella mangrovi TaxID=1515746 RepID=A0A094LRJ6_9GAMM|nr:ABC transporter substrate-binding protein [Shewanella mangrovi]KFZ37793.1 ABC transporter substrate-binding protein [Shewanella mangrovi]
MHNHSFIARSVLAMLLLLPALSWAEDSRTIHYDGKTVVLPHTIERVATSWESQNSVLAMLGFGDKIVATTRYARSTPAFQKFIPSITNTELSTMGGSGDVNVEQLMRLHPDLMLVAEGFPKTKKVQLEAAGIAVVDFTSDSFAALLHRVTVVGEMLGPDATKRAKAYTDYFAWNQQRVAERLVNVPADKRVRVYVASGTPLTTSGRPSLNQDWMDFGGAINVAEHWQLASVMPNDTNVNIESVLAANPDVIIAMRKRDVAAIKKDPRWRTVSAVKNNRIYANPRGLFWWSRNTSEEALQFLWLATKLYPQQFKDIDMKQETHDFYQKFYNIDLSDDDVEAFLQQLPLKSV